MVVLELLAQMHPFPRESSKVEVKGLMSDGSKPHLIALFRLIAIKSSSPSSHCSELGAFFVFVGLKLFRSNQTIAGLYDIEKKGDIGPGRNGRRPGAPIHTH